MKICIICKQEIKGNESYKENGADAVHMKCAYPKTIHLTQNKAKKAKRTQD